MPAQAQWYFDFVSPYAYLQFKRLNEVPPSLDYEMVPILFAGLLKQWEHKGPAEIAPKRIDTYRHCQWLAEDLGIPFRLPQAHPFNPLPYLRLCISLGSSPEVINSIFSYIWTESPPVHSEAGIEKIARRLEIDDLKAFYSARDKKSTTGQHRTRYCGRCLRCPDFCSRYRTLLGARPDGNAGPMACKTR